MRWCVATDIDHEGTQPARLDSIDLAANGLGELQCLRKPSVEFPVQLANELGPVDVHGLGRQPLHHEPLHLDMGEAKLLVVAFGFVCRKVLPKGPARCPGERSCALR